MDLQKAFWDLTVEPVRPLKKPAMNCHSARNEVPSLNRRFLFYVFLLSHWQLQTEGVDETLQWFKKNFKKTYKSNFSKALKHINKLNRTNTNHKRISLAYLSYFGYFESEDSHEFNYLTNTIDSREEYQEENLILDEALWIPKGTCKSSECEFSIVPCDNILCGELLAATEREKQKRCIII